jgi:signal transduction histidine kinase
MRLSDGRVVPNFVSQSLRGQPLTLTALEFDLLWCLARSAGRVLTRDHLLESIAGRDYEVFDRSIDVHISALRPRRTDVTAERQQDQVRIAISDHGPGVPPAALQILFEPFYRLEPDRARATGGTGLGLAIVKACVEACQGTVSARNLSPSGLEVSILLRAA